MLPEFEILGFGIRDSSQRIRNSANVWNLGSKFHLQGIQNPESTAWSPETRMILGVVETIIGLLLCCGVGIAQFLFNRRLVVAPVRITKKLNSSLF